MNRLPVPGDEYATKLREWLAGVYQEHHSLFEHGDIFLSTNIRHSPQTPARFAVRVLLYDHSGNMGVVYLRARKYLPELREAIHRSNSFDIVEFQTKWEIINPRLVLWNTDEEWKKDWSIAIK